MSDFDLFNNPTGLIPSSREILQAFFDIPVATFASMVGIALWIFVLSLPLTRIDRRDSIAGMTYSFFMCTCAVVLILVCAGNDGGLAEADTYFLICLAAATIAGLRWFKRPTIRKAYVEISTEGGPR